MSNAERQAQFRAAHPGYNKKYRGPSMKAFRARQAALQRAAAAAEAAKAAEATPVASDQAAPTGVPERAAA